MSTSATTFIPEPGHAAVEHGHHEHKQSFFSKYIWSLDHKMIGLQYLWTSFFFLLIGGLLAMGIRFQLAYPGMQVPLIGALLPSTIAIDGVILPGGYNMLFTMHATVMVFLVVMPLLIGGFGNYLIPLKIGAGDMAFPTLNAMSYWLYVLSGIIILASFFVDGGAAQSGWTAYAPLSSTPAYMNNTQIGQSLWCVGLFVNGLSSIAGATNYITTITNMRAPGMTMFRLPLSVWALFLTAWLLILAVPVLSAAAAMLFADLNFGTTFFAAQGGQPLLWQHLFWFFGHPEVYIMILPAMGLV